MPNNLFTVDPLTEIDPNKNYLEELVGEGKKYASVEELAKSKVYGDVHISRLEQEQAEIRNELNNRISMEEFLTKLNTAQPAQQSNQPPQAGDENANSKSAMSQEELRQMIQDNLTQFERQKAAQNNLRVVQERLQGEYGPAYASKLKQQAAELGMSEQEVVNLAERNPKALFKLLGVGEHKQDLFATPPRSEINSFSTPSGSIRGKSYYDKMYKEDPKRYFSAATYNERFKAIQEMGQEAFDKN